MRGNANRLQIFLFNFSPRRYIKIELRSTVFTLTQSAKGEGGMLALATAFTELCFPYIYG